jgi:hypothetical protein
MNPKPRLKVPSQHQAALASVGTLAPGDVAALVEALHGMPELATKGSLSAGVRGVLPRLAEQADDLVNALVSLALLRATHGWEVDELAESVASAENLSDGQPTQLAAALKELLKIPSISTVAEAYDASNSYERVLHNARIVSDLRPLFGEQTDGPPCGMVISHSLQVHSLHEGRIQEICFALGDDDLVELRRQVDRALERSKSLRRFSDKSGLPVFTPEREV